MKGDKVYIGELRRMYNETLMSVDHEFDFFFLLRRRRTRGLQGALRGCLESVTMLLRENLPAYSPFGEV